MTHESPRVVAVTLGGRIPQRILPLFAVAAMSFTSLACGTIIHGTKQKVSLSITPPEAQVSVYRWNGERLAGPTSPPGPLVVPRPKQRELYVIIATTPGHCPRYWLPETVSTVGGNLSKLVQLGYFGGGPFEVFDDSTGGCCAISSDSLSAVLPEQGQCPE